MELIRIVPPVGAVKNPVAVLRCDNGEKLPIPGKRAPTEAVALSGHACGNVRSCNTWDRYFTVDLKD